MDIIYHAIYDINDARSLWEFMRDYSDPVGGKEFISSYILKKFHQSSGMQARFRKFRSQIIYLVPATLLHFHLVHLIKSYQSIEIKSKPQPLQAFFAQYKFSNQKPGIYATWHAELKKREVMISYKNELDIAHASTITK